MEDMSQPFAGKIVESVTTNSTAPASPESAGEIQPGCVICPNCCHQFRAIPEDVQASLRTAAPGMGWIAVSERLPKARIPVLFIDNFTGNHPVVCYGFKELDDPDSRQWFSMTSTDSDGDYQDTFTVTHWQPLPAAPLQSSDRK